MLRTLSRIPGAIELTLTPKVDSLDRTYVVQWQDLTRWDLKSARAATFRATHPSFRRLGDFIEEVTELVNPAQEPDHEWPVFGVNNKDGVVFSHVQKGETFNARYKRIREDWFFHNPTRANVGSLGRVPAVPRDAITSPEYQVWRITHGLLPEFVQILIRLPFFLDLVDFHRVGTVKERFFVENLREIPIPVLSEEKQRVIITRWHEAKKKIVATHLRISELESELHKKILKVLEIAEKSKLALPKAFVLQWKELTRWSVEFLERQYSGTGGANTGRFPTEQLAALCYSVSGGTPSKRNPNYWNGDIPWVSPKDMKTAELFDSQDHVTQAAVDETISLVPENSVLIVVRSGILQRVVPIAVNRVPVSINQDLRALIPRDQRLSSDYLAAYLNSQQGALLELVKWSTTVQSINKEELARIIHDAA